MGTPGSASGLGKRARSNPGTAPQADSTEVQSYLARPGERPAIVRPCRSGIVPPGSGAGHRVPEGGHDVSGSGDL